MITKLAEYICDICGQADYMLLGKEYIPHKEQAKENGWITKKGHHFCCKECYNKWIEKGK